MVKVVVDDSEHTIIEIIHVIPELYLETINLPREMIVDAEIEQMEEELKEDHPSFHLVFSYPQRKIMAEPKDETYKEAINKIEDFAGIRGLKVITRGVKYYNDALSELKVKTMDELKTMEELKPCPFCGNKPIMQHTKYPMTEYWLVKCLSCFAEINNPRIEEKEAIEDWNKRIGIN